MKEPRINNLTNAEKVARHSVNIENDVKFFSMGSDNHLDNLAKKESISKFNTQVDEYVEKFNKRAETIEEFTKEVIENAPNLEIMPILNYVLVKPFSENPFQRIKVEKGIITDLGGQAPIFKNKDNGEYEEEKNFIKVATVIEVGKECKYIKSGDTIMYTTPSEIPVPFFKQGLTLVNETRVIVVINEGLKKRFNQE